MNNLLDVMDYMVKESQMPQRVSDAGAALQQQRRIGNAFAAGGPGHSRRVRAGGGEIPALPVGNPMALVRAAQGFGSKLKNIGGDMGQQFGGMVDTGGGVLEGLKGLFRQGAQGAAAGKDRFGDLAGYAGATAKMAPIIAAIRAGMGPAATSAAVDLPRRGPTVPGAGDIAEGGKIPTREIIAPAKGDDTPGGLGAWLSQAKDVGGNLLEKAKGAFTHSGGGMNWPLLGLIAAGGLGAGGLGAWLGTRTKKKKKDDEEED